MKKVIIVGCGSHAAELVEYIEQINNFNHLKIYDIKGFIDIDQISFMHYDYSYDFLDIYENHIIDHNCYYLIGIGNVMIREKVIKDLKLKKAKFLTIIHPTAIVSKSCIIGEGNLISHNVSIGPKSKIGDFNVINSRATLGHDVYIQDNNFISPQVVLGGFVRMGSKNMIGTNSCVIPSVEIGNNNKIMAGMTLTNNLKNDETVFYKYKERIIYGR